MLSPLPQLNKDLFNIVTKHKMSKPISLTKCLNGKDNDNLLQVSYIRKIAIESVLCSKKM